MLVGLKDVLAIAEKNSYAVGAFNVPNLECIRSVINNAEKYNVPVILSHFPPHEYAAPLDVIGPIMLLSAERASVPVCVHLDHCDDMEYMKRALDLGFTGVMYDGSTLPYDENVAGTLKAVELAHSYGVGIEAEIGKLAAREGGIDDGAPIYTEPEFAVRFVADTGVDALAISFGTSHGIYKSNPVLDLDRVGEIDNLVDVPLVMHGGSGVSPDDYRAAIKNGIRKINYFSYMSNEGTKAAIQLLNSKDITFFQDITFAAQQAMTADAEKAMKVFYNL
ncbi:MAG: class II fructose-bisphosphate aldolase [Ruminococcaceae bacterium]|nr:class II fructose-bisphosphate aldolase [Oscillospiraceae bacterium]